MSDSTTSNTDDGDTHRVINKPYERTTTGETFAVGDTITPTEGELAAFGSGFQQLPSSGSSQQPETDVAGASTVAPDTPTEAADATDEATASEFDPATGDPHELTPRQFAALNYAELRQIATRTENVSGNAPEDEMRVGLADVYGIDHVGE